ncbi:MAG: DUF2961 domain-containing protein [Armatimonadetes bacterium]|nr:DUF2961 domain-containing protein [Armatimonadota bacterium]
MSQGPLSQIAIVRDAVSKRISSYDRSGGNADNVPIGPRETFVMAEFKGSGIIKHIWITIASQDPMVRKNLVLRMFWDGADHPSVEAPIGDFFGQGWGMKYNFTTLPLAAAPKDGNALVSYFPMPYADGCRIEVENQSDIKVDCFYYYVDTEELIKLPDSAGRFHAWYNQELTSPEADGDREHEWGIWGITAKNPTDVNNYLFCECEGKGHFAGVNYYIENPTTIWYGEGDDMFMVDGEPWPGSAHGTGTEDYFNQSWSPDEHYLHPYFGTGYAPGRNNEDPLFGWIGRTHVYRFHLEDPIHFSKSLRASIEHGHANGLTLNLSSVAYWYQSSVGKKFPAMPKPEDRRPLEPIGAVDIHRWRDAWRKSMRSGPRWGKETETE